MTISGRRLSGLLGLGILTLLGFGFSPSPTQAQAPVVAAAAGPKQVLLIRHGEKPGDSAVDADSDPDNLSTRGFERAGALAPYIPATFGRPDSLFATKASKHSNRPVETIAPLSAALGIKIDSDFADTEDDLVKLAKQIRTHPRYAGKRVLICWHHGKLADLAAALGVSPKPKKWPGDVFDLVWQLDYSGGTPTMTVVPQKLLFGDASD